MKERINGLSAILRLWEILTFYPLVLIWNAEGYYLLGISYYSFPLIASAAKLSFTYIGRE